MLEIPGIIKLPFPSSPYKEGVYLLLILFLVKLFFGRQLTFFWDWLITRFRLFFQKDKSYSLKKWNAKCVDRVGWLQKSIAQSLDLKSGYLKKLSFETAVVNKPENWRAGFIIGNEEYRPELVIDDNNAITVHTGAPPILKNAYHVWYYDKNHVRNHPGASTIIADENKLNFLVEVTDNNYLKVHINSQLIYTSRIPSSFRKKVYLLAWGDYSDCEVNFTNIKWTATA